MEVKMKLIGLFETPWTIAYQAPQKSPKCSIWVEYQRPTTGYRWINFHTVRQLSICTLFTSSAVYIYISTKTAVSLTSITKYVFLCGHVHHDYLLC